MEKKKAQTIEGYIANAPEKAQQIMRELQNLIEETVPKAEGGISYNVPIYKYHGILVGFSLATKHISFGMDALQEKDRQILKEKGYKTGKKTVQIQFDQQLPKPELISLLQKQAKMNQL